jgi:S-adenosylmethionine-diacylglycerol 3-amino-3-carboxypropyl transferase
MTNFYSRLSYSFGNEDWATEHKALQITPSDRVLCVTASGDRPLNLMTARLREIIAIDANPLQNALFDLKKVALTKLSYADYMAFLGIKPSKNRLQTFAKLEKNLDPMTTALWELLPKKIEKGILYQGSVEKLLKIASSCLRTFRGKKIDKLFSIKNIQEQQQFIESQWHTYLWKKTFHFVLHPVITRNLIKDPGLYEHIEPNIHVGNQLYERLHNYLKKNLARDSLLLSLIFNGKVDPRHFPPYLTEDGIAKIKKQVSKARFHTDDLVSYIGKAESNSFDCFSVSDVASYMNKEDFNRLMQGIYRCAKPGARFCIRQFLSNHEIPEDLAPHFKRNRLLDNKLQEEDRCCVYRFMTGTIEKEGIIGK